MDRQEHRYIESASTSLTKKNVWKKRHERHYNLKMAKLNLRLKDISTAMKFCAIAENDQKMIDDIERFFPHL